MYLFICSYEGISLFKDNFIYLFLLLFLIYVKVFYLFQGRVIKQTLLLGLVSLVVQK